MLKLVVHNVGFGMRSRLTLNLLRLIYSTCQILFLYELNLTYTKWSVSLTFTG
jgi:hypothetical protein